MIVTFNITQTPPTNCKTPVMHTMQHFYASSFDLRH